VGGAGGGVCGSGGAVEAEVTGAGADGSAAAGFSLLWVGLDRAGEGAGAGAGSGAGRFPAASGCGGVMVVESMTCLTPLVWEAMRSAARRAASSGTMPVMVTMPSLLVTLTVGTSEAVRKTFSP